MNGGPYERLDCELVRQLSCFCAAGADPEPLGYQQMAGLVGTNEVPDCRRGLGPKAPPFSYDRARLVKIRLPAVITRSDSNFLLPGRVTTANAVVKDLASDRPQVIKKSARYAPLDRLRAGLHVVS